MSRLHVIASAAVLIAACGRSKTTGVIKLADEPAVSTVVTGFVADDSGIAWLASDHDGVTLKTLGPDHKIVVVAHGTLLGVAIDHDAVYWIDGEHVWRAPRNTATATKLVDLDHSPDTLVRAGTYLYWTTADTLSRVATTGGAIEVVAASPEAHGRIVSVAVDGPTIVATVSLQSGDAFKTEVWRLDGNARKIGMYEGLDHDLAIDGDQVWIGIRNGDADVATQLAINGGPPGVQVKGHLIAAHGGTVYVSRPEPEASSGTYATNVNGSERRIGPPMSAGVLTATQLVGVFVERKKSGSVLGAIDR